MGREWLIGIVCGAVGTAFGVLLSIVVLTLRRPKRSWVELPTRRASVGAGDYGDELHERISREARNSGRLQMPSVVPRFEVPEQAEPVILGVSTLQSAALAEEFTARFAAYSESHQAVVDDILKKLSPRSQSHLGLKTCRWQRGTEVRVHVHGRGLTVAPREQGFFWEPPYVILNFDVVVNSDAAVGVTVLKFDVMIAGFVVARLRLDITICRDGHERQLGRATAIPASKAFASYASKDRQRVLDRVSEIQRNGVDVFLDCHSLNPGDEWKPRLEQEIKERCLFILFWSTHAKESKLVEWEWRTALSHKGIEGIDPHPLDPTHVAEPPEELKTLHFGDRFMLTRALFDKGGPF